MLIETTHNGTLASLPPARNRRHFWIEPKGNKASGTFVVRSMIPNIDQFLLSKAVTPNAMMFLFGENSPRDWL